MFEGGVVAVRPKGTVMYSAMRLSPKPEEPSPPSPWGPTVVNGINLDSVVEALHETDCPTDRWVCIKAVVDGEGLAVEVAWQDEPFEEELELRAAMIPEELRNAFTKLRDMDDLEDDEGYEHTEQGLYDREKYLSFEGSQPERFDREPHLEITDIKLGRNFSLPVGCVVRDAKTGDKYIAAVNPNWNTGSVRFGEGFSEGSGGWESWDLEPAERQPVNAPIAGAAVPIRRLTDIDISSWEREDIDRLLRTWGDAVRSEAERKVHGRRVHPGAKNVLTWIEQSRERIAKGEGLDEIKVRVSAFLERLDQLEGIPTELPWEE